jgi:predicted DNA-binding transcriptional regulator AlpA
MPVSPEPTLTARQVADFLNVSPRWVLTQFENGDMPGFKLNDTPKGRVRFRMSQIEAWLAERQRNQVA